MAISERDTAGKMTTAPVKLRRHENSVAYVVSITTCSIQVNKDNCLWMSRIRTKRMSSTVVTITSPSC